MAPARKILLLLAFFILCAAAILGTYWSRQRIPAPPPRELFSLVNGQLSELRAADFRGAYASSASAVQQHFSLPQFEQMIEHDFTPMLQRQRVEFGQARVVGGSALVQVFLVAPDGAIRSFLYSFTRERGGWKIDGVEPLGPGPGKILPGLHI